MEAGFLLNDPLADHEESQSIRSDVHSPDRPFLGSAKRPRIENNNEVDDRLTESVADSI